MLLNNVLTPFLMNTLPALFPDTSAIRTLRRDFINYLVNIMGIDSEFNRGLSFVSHEGAPVENTLDLGSGNVIVPYVLNENSQMHATSWVVRQVRNTFRETSTLERTPVQEGGFALVVGRAGMRSTMPPQAGIFGLNLPYGTVVKYGFRVLFLESDPDNPVVMQFQDVFPEEANFQVTSEVLQFCRIVSPQILAVSSGYCVGSEQLISTAQGNVKFNSKLTYVEEPGNIRSRATFSWQSFLGSGLGRFVYSSADQSLLTNLPPSIPPAPTSPPATP